MFTSDHWSIANFQFCNQVSKASDHVYLTRSASWSIYSASITYKVRDKIHNKLNTGTIHGICMNFTTKQEKINILCLQISEHQQTLIAFKRVILSVLHGMCKVHAAYYLNQCTLFSSFLHFHL